MQKIFTLLFAVGTISIASAQSKDFGHSNQVSSYYYNGKQNEIQKINREYDFTITAIKMNRRLNGWEKSKQIRMPESKRQQEIAQLQYRFEKNHRQYDDKGFTKNNKHRW